MRASLQTRAADFTQEFDRELTRIYRRVPRRSGRTRRGRRASGRRRSSSRPRSIAAVPGLIRGRLPARRHRGRRPTSCGDSIPPTRTLAAGRLAAGAREPGASAHRRPLPLAAAGGCCRCSWPTPWMRAAPALIIPVPFVKKIDDGAGHFAVVPNPASAGALADRLARCRSTAAATARAAGREILRRAASVRVPRVHRAARPAVGCRLRVGAARSIDERSADVSAGLFDLRMDEMTRMTGVVQAARTERCRRRRIAWPSPSCAGRAAPATPRAC